MDESEYVIYEECSSLPTHGNDGQKVVTISNGFQIPSPLVMSSVCASSNQSTLNNVARASVPLPPLMKECVPHLSQSDVLDSKSPCANQINILPSNILSFQEDSSLQGESKNKSENGNESLFTSSYYGTLDNGYRLLLTPLPYSTFIKSNSSEKNIPTLLSSNLSSSVDTPCDSIADANETKDEHWTTETSSPLVLNAKGKKGPSQVVVKLLQDDLNFDMVEIISPHLDNSPMFKFIEKDSEINKITPKEVDKDISPDSLKFVPLNDNAKIIPHDVNIGDMNPTCDSLPTKLFSSELISTVQKKEVLPYTNNSVKGTQVDEELFDVFHKKSGITDDETNLGHSKTNIFWVCLICCQEFISNSNLKKHYVSHSVEELANALLKLTLPINCKKEKSSNIDQATMTESQTLELNKVESSIIGILKNADKCRNKESPIVNNIRKSVSLDPLDVSVGNSKSFVPNSITVPSADINKNKTSKSIKKMKTNCRNKNKLKPVDTGLKSRDPHTCSICKKVLSSRGNLAKHLIQHQVVKPWVCKECNAGFNSKRNHDHHYMQKHTTMRPNVCTICAKGYANKRTLTEHMIFHRKEKEFSCQLCHKTFSTKKCVNRHMQRHEKNRKFVCKICFKAFRVNVDLVSHLKLVHDSGKKRAKSKIHNIPKSESSNLSSNQLDHYSQSQIITEKKPQEQYERDLDQQSTLTQQIQIVSNADQLHKIKEFSDLLQSNCSPILPHIANEFQSANLGETRETLFINGDIDTQSIITVPSTNEDQVFNNTYDLTLHNKTALINQDISSPNTFVMIGLSELQDGSQNNTAKMAWNTSHEYKAIYQDPCSTKEVDNSQSLTEINLLPSVIESISRTYPGEIEQAEPSKFQVTNNTDDIPKSLRRMVTSGKCVNAKYDNNLTASSDLPEKSAPITLSSAAQTPGLNLELLSPTFQLDFQTTPGNNPGFIQ